MKKKPTATGWKVFDKDLKCRGMQFEVGKTYKESGTPRLCHNGFHFHTEKSQLFNYYDFDPNNRVCEIIAWGGIDKGDDKTCTVEIEIVKELSWDEVLKLVNIGISNTGRNNTGNWNTGNRNTGNWNTGNRNTGDRNTGHMNTGNRNTGNRNTGNWNTGNWNTGNWNTGDLNTGNRNTGDWNTTNYSCGIFNTIEQPTPIFNGAASVIMSEFRNTPNYEALFSSRFPLTEWIYESSMTEAEKTDHPKFYVQEGYLKVRTFQETCAIWWAEMTDNNKELVKSIPGFTPSIFTEVTGIKL